MLYMSCQVQYVINTNHHSRLVFNVLVDIHRYKRGITLIFNGVPFQFFKPIFGYLLRGLEIGGIFRYIVLRAPLAVAISSSLDQHDNAKKFFHNAENLKTLHPLGGRSPHVCRGKDRAFPRNIQIFMFKES